MKFSARVRIPDTGGFISAQRDNFCSVRRKNRVKNFFAMSPDLNNGFQLITFGIPNSNNRTEYFA